MVDLKGNPPPTLSAQNMNRPSAAGPAPTTVGLSAEARIAQLESLCARLSEQLRRQEQVLAALFPTPGVIELVAERRIDLKVGGTSISLDDINLKMQTTVRAAVTAAKVEVAASTVALNASLTSASGIVKCPTLQANAVIASSYTPRGRQHLVTGRETLPAASVPVL
ncbi:hypothetical protein [Zavarzinia compransoris]|uniref:Uncharacterized protein n=1 Tax=Zavarzinia compransoris TaxID=1264899 RepID=A0A317E0V5_9PROT|nr:hypothetical protein [Zavarzinia compransoris]PWR19750.1 hypothetical protein DKG75_14905 [Zavarzinia compransoris]TDP45149.1 hypothetical protein DES42_106372 [Zavarzinia compransoris]